MAYNRKPMEQRTRKIVEGKCIYCGNTFISKFRSYQRAIKQKYCNRTCANRARRDENVKRLTIIARQQPSMEKSPYWKGGINRYNGYLYKYLGKGKYIKMHRWVMEQHLGRKLEPFEVVHHKNGKRDDNRVENLQITNLNEHSRSHALKQWARAKAQGSNVLAHNNL